MTNEKCYVELCTAVAEVNRLMEAEGHYLPSGPANQHYSGNVLLRLQPTTYQRRALQAKANGECLNPLLTRKWVVN